ncbi:MAG: hypothetical protein ACREMB_22985 [Candidatus Rokuibacteriota bacterium]
MAGQRVTEGVLYRFIPNLAVYWEYDRDRPSPRAFRSRPGEKDGVSMYIEGHTTLERLKALRPSFGIYGIEVERLLQEERLSVNYDPDGTLPEGRAHVTVIGVNRRVAEWIGREVAYRVKPPDPAVQSLTTPVETQP